MSKTCLYCVEVLGCRYLSDSGGIFVPERVITEENLRECPDWNPIGDRQRWVRDMLYGLQGDSAVRVLHQMPKIIMDSLVKQEQEDKDMPIDDNPDFASMIRQGMTTAEREEQLRYETDGQGNVLVDEHGQKRPRPQYVINKFACSTDGHIKLDHSAGMFYKTDEVIKYILDQEVELGLIMKSKKSKKPTEAQPSETQQETTMPIAGRKIIRPTKGATAAQEPAVDESAPPAPAAKAGPVSLPRAPGKIGMPPKRPQVTQQAEPQEAAAPALDIQELQAAVAQAVEAAVSPLLEKVAALEAQIADTKETVIVVASILHDLSAQTGGTFQADGKPLDDVFEKEGKLLSYMG